MFEKLVESILVEYVSEWVDGLDAEKMKIGLFGGKVEVRDLTLRAAALEKFQLPLQVKKGTIGRLAMKVPWKRLTKEAVRIVVEDVYVLVAPVHPGTNENDGGDDDLYAMRMRFTKQQEIRMHELLVNNANDEGIGLESSGLSAAGLGTRPSAADAVGGGANTDTTAWGYRDKILHNIMDNVCFEIKNIHVRYEDTTQAISSRVFAMGITIDYIHIRTTNATGQASFMDRAQSHTMLVHRTLEVVQAGCYMDDSSSVRDLALKRQQKPPPEMYILHPFTTTAKLTVNHDDSALTVTPKVQIVTEIGSINTAVTPQQCSALVGSINSISAYETCLKHIHIHKRRPKQTVKENPRAWWKHGMYGAQVLFSLSLKKGKTAGSLHRTRCSWVLFAKLWLIRKEYTTIKKGILAAAASKSGSIPDKQVQPDGNDVEQHRLLELEDEMDAETVVFFRRCAEQEYELEQNRRESVKKVGWKKKWRSSATSTPTPSSLLHGLAPVERLLLYEMVMKQMLMSSTALAVKEERRHSSKAMLFAFNVEVMSFSLSLVEIIPRTATRRAHTQEFLKVELTRILFGFIRRAKALTLTASLQSLEILQFGDHNGTTLNANSSHQLFFMLESSSPKPDQMASPSTVDDYRRNTPTNSDAKELNEPKRFFDLLIDSSKRKFILKCECRPFRYIHSLTIADRLVEYFASQIDTIPELKDNAEEVFANSSTWFNSTVFASPVSPPEQPGCSTSGDTTHTALREVEISVSFPLVDILLLYSDTSPILETKLSAVQLKFGTPKDSFVFIIEAVEMLFLDSIPVLSSRADSLNERSISDLCSEPSGYKINRRKISRILRKTRLVFNGTKTTYKHRSPKWTMKCTAPPIFFTLTNAQYCQALQAISPKETTGSEKLSSRDRLPTPGSYQGKASTLKRRFDPAEETLALCIHIPQMTMVLKGCGGNVARETYDDDNSKETVNAIDLVFDMHAANIVAKMTPVAQAMMADFRQLTLFKHTRTVDDLENTNMRKAKTSATETIAEINKGRSCTRKSDLPDEPESVYDSRSLSPTNKLVDVGQRVTLVVSCFDPLKCTVKAHQVALYWDLELMFVLMRSFVQNGPVETSSMDRSGYNSQFTTSAPSCESTVPALGRESAMRNLNGEELLDDQTNAVPMIPFRIEIFVDKWFLFMRPPVSPLLGFEFKGYGRDLTVEISILKGKSTNVQLCVKKGFNLESTQQIQHRSGVPSGSSTEHESRVGVCNLMRAENDIAISIEDACTGEVLAHRENATTFLSVEASDIEVNYIHTHFIVFTEYMELAVLGASDCGHSQLDRVDISPTPWTKVDANVHNITILAPRGALVNEDESRRKPERLEITIAKLTIATQATSSALQPIRQLQFRALDIALWSILPVGVQPNATDMAHHIRDISERKARIFEHDCVYIDYTPPEDQNKTTHGVDRDHCEREINSCDLIQIAFTRPRHWSVCNDSIEKKDVTIVPRRLLTVSIEQEQLELLMCVFDDNFGSDPPHSEPLLSMCCLSNKDTVRMDVKMELDECSLLLLHPSTKTGDKTQLEHSGGCMGRVDVEGVSMSVSTSPSLRTQAHIKFCKVKIWKTDAVPGALVSLKAGALPHSMARQNHVECAEFYPATTSENGECVDIRIGSAPNAPQTVQIHIHTCALVLEPLISLVARIHPLLVCQPRFLDYVPTKAKPVSASITAGSMYVQVAQHHQNNLSDIGAKMKSERGRRHCSPGELSPLNLVLSGCVSIKVSTTDGVLDTVQVFGRNMALELSTIWPPLSKGPIHVEKSPSLRGAARILPRKTLNSAAEITAPTEYMRVLCDNFSVDMDLLKSAHGGNSVTISASLAHFHAVVCTFDMFLISKTISEYTSTDCDIPVDPSPACSGAIKLNEPLVDNHSVNWSMSVSLVLENCSVTMVREIDAYFSPLVRIHAYSAQCIASVIEPRLVDAGSAIVNVELDVRKDKNGVESDVQETDGLSVWCFNAVLGAWEPLMEPCLFTINFRTGADAQGKIATNIEACGCETSAFSVNFSPALFDSCCAIMKECEPLLAGNSTIVPTTAASVISCGFYLANDSGVDIDFWMSEPSAAIHPNRSHGFISSSRSSIRQTGSLKARHRLPLTLSASTGSAALANDQAISFSWGNDSDWHPLTDVRIHSAGKHIYSLLPKPASRTSSAAGQSDANIVSPVSPRVVHALFDYSAVFGYRTLTISSIVRIFNEADIPIQGALLGVDGRTVNEFGVIQPGDVCGVPITMVDSLSTVRLLIRPDKQGFDPSTNASTKSMAVTQLLSVDPQQPCNERQENYRWSNELMINDKHETQESVATCPLVLDDYDCRCQRMFEDSQPLHINQTCRSNGSFFKVWNRVFVATNSSSLKYAQIRILPPLLLENKCNTALYVVVFLFKNVRRTMTGQDKKYSHLVASVCIPGGASSQLLSAPLHASSMFCSISMTGRSWSKLVRLSSGFDTESNLQSSPGPWTTPSTSISTTKDDKGSTTGTASNAQHGTQGSGTVTCSMEDFQSRKASLNVSFHGATRQSALQRVVFQPRFVICNETRLPLTFAPCGVSDNRFTAKSFFSLPTTSKQSSVCCESPHLEMIHRKLNSRQDPITLPVNTFEPNSVSNSGQIDPRDDQRQDEVRAREEFYCSESNAVNIQVRRNERATSGANGFRLDAAMGGSNSAIRVFDESTHHWHDLVAILQQSDAFTTKATFVDRYIFDNRTDHCFLCVSSSDIIAEPQSARQQSPLRGVMIQPRVSSPFHWRSRQHVPSDPTIRIKIDDPKGTGWRWSGKFSLHDVSETAFKLTNKFSNEQHVVRIEVRVESSVRVVVVFTSEDDVIYPLYRVINSSKHEIIHFCQCFDDPATGDSPKQFITTGASLDFPRGAIQRLFPNESTCFGWDEAFFLPSLERMLQITYTTDSVRTNVLLDQPGQTQRVDLPGRQGKPRATSIYVHWYLNGITKTIQIHDTQLPRDQITGQLLVEAGDFDVRGGIALPRVALATEISLTIRIPHAVLSVLNGRPEDMLLFTAERVEVVYVNKRGRHDQCEAKVGSFQIDNQLANAVFPVVFTAMPIRIPSGSPNKAPLAKDTVKQAGAGRDVHLEASSNRDSNVLLHISAIRLHYGDAVEYIKYLSAMLQPARLQIDDYLIVSAAMMVSDCIRIVEKHYPLLLNNDDPGKESSASISDFHVRKQRSRDGSRDGATTIPPGTRRVYMETLVLHPIKLQVTFQQNNLGNATDQLTESMLISNRNMLLPVAFMILKTNLANIDAASLNLNALHVFHSFTTRSFIMSAIQQHYTFQGILQSYALIGAADILGNPLGLVTNLGTGVKDFFYEPMAGMVTSPQDFVAGLSRGTASLVKNSVYGTFNAASKLTGSLSSGIAALSMDQSYITSRNTRMRQEVATHIGTGLFYGTKQLGQGIFAGVSGVITAPAKGAYENGLTGFVEGMGRGLIGVAVKPTAGVLDLAARATAGITATTTVFDRKARNTRMRLPRMVHASDKRLRVYSSEDAMLNHLLRGLPQRLLRNEQYDTHIFLPQNRVLVATSHQILLIEFRRNSNDKSEVSNGEELVTPSLLRVTWKYSLTSLLGAQRTARGVNILIGTSKSVALTSSASTPTALAAGPVITTQNTMSAVLIALREHELAAIANRLTRCISELAAKERERASAARADSYSTPRPRNAIGMVLEPISPDTMVGVAGYNGSGGRVVDVFAGSPCYRAGVKVGDIIVGFGKKSLEAGDHGSELRTQLSMMMKGDTLELMVLRNGDTRNVTVVTE